MAHRYLTGTSDRPALDYKCGDEAVFSVWALEGYEKRIPIKRYDWKTAGDFIEPRSGSIECKDPYEKAIIKLTKKEAGFINLTVNAIACDGEAIQQFSGGVGFEPEKLTTTVTEPAEYRKFWDNVIADVENCSITPYEIIDVSDDIRPSHKIYDIKIESAYSRPVSGLLAIHKGAAEKSLPIKLLLHGYGIYSSQKMVDARAIVFDMNANGINNLQAPEYYEELRTGELKDYAVDTKNVNTPYEYYMKEVIARGLLALRFLRSLPEWNGRDITVCGTSQGGFQAISLAALDRTVTKCEAHKPWFSDLHGMDAGKQAGSFRPAAANEVTSYFDNAVQARRIECEVQMSAGLGDVCCPPSSVLSVYRQIPSKNKSITFIQAEQHSSGVPIKSEYIWNFDKEK